MRAVLALTLVASAWSLVTAYVGDEEFEARKAEQRGLQVAPNKWIVSVDDFTPNATACNKLGEKIAKACGTHEDLAEADFAESCVVIFTCDEKIINQGKLDAYVGASGIIEPNLIMFAEGRRGRKGKGQGRRRKGTKSPTPAPSTPANVGEDNGEGGGPFKKTAKSWGLDRINQASLPLDGTYSANYDGHGVNIYVVDTGVQGDHEELKGRYTQGADFVNENTNGYDLNGHGTHCAGTAAGKEYGVAPGASVIGVKVLSQSGAGEAGNVVRGIQWAVQNQKKYFGGAAAVINLSLGGTTSKSMQVAAAQAAKAGMIVVVAAGNNNRDACQYSPANAGGQGLQKGGVITVMSSDNNDKRSSFSNYGKCTDIIAPGTDITSAWKNNGYNTISGTSMAAPHVAGIAAQLLQKHKFDKSAAISELFNVASLDTIRGAKAGSKNMLAQIADSYTGHPTPQATIPPTFAESSLCVDNEKYCIEKKVVPSTFTPDMQMGTISSHKVVFVEDVASDKFGCDSYSKSSSVKDAIVVVSRGGCSYHQKVKHAQSRGAKAVLVYQDSFAVAQPMGSSNGDLDIYAGMIARAVEEQLREYAQKYGSSFSMSMGSSA